MRGGVGDRHRRPVEIRAYAERVEFWQEGKVVGKHARAFGRDKAIYDPLHYIPVLARKPGALRNGAPFKDWDLPPAMRRIQRKLGRVPNGDRQMADILCTVLIDGLAPPSRGRAWFAASAVFSLPLDGGGLGWG